MSQILNRRPSTLIWTFLLCLGMIVGGAGLAAAQPVSVLFESGPVRPVALSPDGQRLFVTNVSEGHLEIYDLDANGLMTFAASVSVGLEPVAVAPRNDAEVWVVNHLSDSVSIVDVASTPPRVVRTLLVGDEPRDIVFAGSPNRAFISTARRGQHRTDGSISAVTGAGDPAFTTEGIGRADVWVFDAAAPGAAIGGLPVQILTYFADTPRALATDGTTVYVAAFHSGNQTTSIRSNLVPDGFATGCGPGGVGTGVPGPSTNAAGDPAPETGLIVKFDGSDWVDAQGCTWNTAVNLSLPDQDVFAVNANTLASGSVFSGVGTILFNMAINPVTGKLYVTNLESRNDTRFEGPGVQGGSTVQGRIAESRVSVLDPVGVTVDAQHLNQHIDYSLLHTNPAASKPTIEAQIPHSLATPLQAVVSSDLADQKVYVAAFGSAKIGVMSASALEDTDFETNFQPTVESANYIPTGGGPAGLSLNADNDRLYVYTRFDNALTLFDVGRPDVQQVQTLRLPTTEPSSVIEGRPFLYDAATTSGNGEASCASCHIFGDFDSLSWNLGNPDDVTTSNPQNVLLQGPGAGPDFHPMKGPMSTQTLRGLANHGGMHWRGDRTNGFFNPSPSPCTDPVDGDCDEELSFDNFIVAFEGLIGHDGTIPVADMEKFTDFALQLTLPPNPVAALDGSQTAAQSSGQTHFSFLAADAAAGGLPCSFCHTVNPAAGFFGTGGLQTVQGEPQLFKVPHLRNMYAKVGMFGNANATANLGDQVRGFGFLHDGSVDTMFNFLETVNFNLTPTQSSELEQFMLAFGNDIAPVVGQQVSVGPDSDGSLITAGAAISADVTGRINLLAARADTAFTSAELGGLVTECDLIAKTVDGGAAIGYTKLPAGDLQPDDGGAVISVLALRDRALTAGGNSQNIVFSCVPPGSGTRMGIDRDLDSVLDGVDNCPAWPNGAAGGTCIAGDAVLLSQQCTANLDCGTGGVCSLAQEDTDTNGTGDACEATLLPEPDSHSLLFAGLGLLTALSLRRSRSRERAVYRLSC